MINQWDFFNRREVGETSIIHAVEMSLFQEDLEEHDITIYADIVTINSVIRLPGRNVMLHVRRIICQGNAILDVSGDDADDGPQPRAQDGRNYGDSGANGDLGKSGDPGGTIRIFAESIEGSLLLKANGGRGSRGQDGGVGMRGADGSPGADGGMNDASNPGQIGGSGGRGGDGGIGGTGGLGGDAGIIDVQVGDKEHGQIQLVSQPGLGGPGGRGGQEGGGGSGGLGGRSQHCHFVNHGIHGGDSEPEWTCHFGDRAAPGAPGASGTPGPVGTLGREGIAKSSSFETVSYIVLGTVADISQCLMLLHRIQLDYLSEDYGSTAARLGWLYRITAESPGAQTPSGDAEFSPSPTTVRPSNSEWGALRNQVLTLMAQLGNGMDFYGLPKNYAPLVAYQFYKSQIAPILSICKDIENSYKGYVDDVEHQRERLDTIEAALVTQQKLVSQSQERKEQSVHETDALQLLIALLLDQIKQQQQLLVDAEMAFQAAVKAQNGCSVGEVLRVVYTVSVAATTGYVNVSSIVDTLEGHKDKDIFRDVKGEISPERRFIKRLEASKGDAQSLLASYNKIKNTLASAYDDSGKIIVEESNYEETLKPYLNLPEARRYKELIRAHVETVKTRNQKIDDYEGELSLQLQLAAQIRQANEEVSRIKALKATTSDPSLIEFKTFMGRLNMQSKQLLIKVLYMERRAWEYWALESHPFDVVDQDVAALEDIHLQLLSSELAVRERRATAPTPITGIPIVVSDETSPDTMKKFRETKKLVFSIQPDNIEFDGWYGMLVKHVEISLFDAHTSNGQLTFKIIHNGRAQVLNQNNEIVLFSHKARTTRIIRSPEGQGPNTTRQNNLGGDAGENAFLSPFATWTLDLSSASNVDLDLSQVKRIVFTFDAVGLSLD